MCRGNAKIKPRGSSYPPQCVLLLCCFKCDGSFLSLTDRQGTGWDRISCLLKLHILNHVGLKLETKNPAHQHFFSFYINISVCIFLSVWVLFLFSFICTLPPLAHHWQEIGGPLFFFLTSHVKLGVLPQFPLLQNEFSVFCTSLTCSTLTSCQTLAKICSRVRTTVSRGARRAVGLIEWAVWAPNLLKRNSQMLHAHSDLYVLFSLQIYSSAI